MGSTMARGRERDGASRGQIRRIALVALLPTMLVACGGGSMFGSSSPSASTEPGVTTSSSGGRGFSDRISDFISGPKPPPPATAPGAAAAEEIDCPPVNIRQGTSTLSVVDPKAESQAFGLRYQGTIVRTARECTVHDKMVTIRVGVQGRVIVGPAGGPGSITMPLRYALVKEGIEPKPIYTKLYTVPVTVEPGQSNALYSHVEESMTVPMPSLIDFDSYVIYVGFDPQSAEKKPARPAKPRR
jgi:hypothetical protein